MRAYNITSLHHSQNNAHLAGPPGLALLPLPPPLGLLSLVAALPGAISGSLSGTTTSGACELLLRCGTRVGPIPAIAPICGGGEIDLGGERGGS